MWCLHCSSERTQSLLELEFDSGIENEAPSSEMGTSLDSPSAYSQGPLVPRSSLSPDHYGHTSVEAHGLCSGRPEQQQPTRRPKLHNWTSILRKPAQEKAIRHSRSLSERYELSSDLQDKQVEMLEPKYGGRLVTCHTARTIQTEFHQC
ncbi:IQ motif and SEC7 domain-containing protein 1 [Plecturocebus cupreus]